MLLKAHREMQDVHAQTFTCSVITGLQPQILYTSSSEFLWHKNFVKCSKLAKFLIFVVEIL